ncbi:KinB-signaling pathway activation protein [Priestia koreensis]|uniref:KinB-signaling pathway activation protein n=1 Tax=Priestia koreensis TaxID=284581 RepID=UPI001F5870CB|nr:KinB-signaling pathway activation protein [Priestia koreensis]MCM3006729.1 KinB-signaling pathway activation protein [Priestia koreensis]UNL85172.1 KinB-signaling pathway activation protein [Priestia koreensis]
MNSRNWVRLFLSTLLIGALSASVVGFAVKWGEYRPFFQSFNIGEILSALLWFIGIGLIFSIISQMGFFAYLTIHRFGLGICRSVSLWNSVQVLLTAFILFDLVYLQVIMASSAESDVSPSRYIMAGIVVVTGLVVALIKVKQTNKAAFIPGLFFMIVVTIIEWVPALRANDTGWLYLMLYPLLICNAYQLLILPRLIQNSQRERRNTSARMKAM